MMGPERWFRDEMERVDSLCQVDFEIEIPYAIRIRPSHPRYRDALIRQAFRCAPLGATVSVIKEVDDWDCVFGRSRAPSSVAIRG